MQPILESNPAPLRPDCLVWYAGDPCDVLIQQYHQAAEQSRRQEWQASVTAPLQRQIVAQQKQIHALQLQIEEQTTEALQSQAHTAAIFEGIGAGLGVAFALFLAVAFFRRLARNSPTLKGEPEGAASA